MADDVKKMQDEMMKQFLEQQKKVMNETYGEHFENIEGMMKDTLANAMSELDNIDISAIQNAVPGVDMETILKKTQEAKEEAMKTGTSAIEMQSEAITKAMNKMFSDNEGLQDMISNQMKNFQAMTGIEDFSKATPEDMQKIYENQMNVMNNLIGLDGDEEYETFSLDDLKNVIEEMYASLPEGYTTNVNSNDEYIKKFEILLSGFLTFMNGHESESLDVEEHNEFFDEKINYILTQFWGIENRDDVFDTINYLLNEGHTAEYLGYAQADSVDEFIDSEMDEEDIEIVKNGFEFAQFFKDKLPENIMLGWDYGRAAAIIRWAYYMKYISEDEAWEILDDIAEIMTNNFNSWKEFGISYIVGGLFWTYRTNPEGTSERYYETLEALEGLMNKTYEEGSGLWAENPWISEVI